MSVFEIILLIIGGWIAITFIIIVAASMLSARMTSVEELGAKHMAEYQAQKYKAHTRSIYAVSTQPRSEPV